MENKMLSTIVYDPKRAYNGYTLFAPLNSSKVWLIDMLGRFVHCWETGYLPGCHGVLLPNGNLLYAGKKNNGPLMEFGGSCGILIELDWNGKEVWRYEDPFMNHDFWRMENGNTMLLRWEAVPDDIAAKIKGGIPGTERKGVIWCTSFHEIDRAGNIVWEWVAYEHLDPDVDTICPLCHRAQWDYTNSIEVLPDGNILTSNRVFNCVTIIDKLTGEIKWRWGQNELGHQHNATMLENGNILIFDNGHHRCQPRIGEQFPFSRVVEVEKESGKIVWEYRHTSPLRFFSGFVSGAERLPNGNTLICSGAQGRFLEVTKECEIVWEYISPFYFKNANPAIGINNRIFRAHRYGPDYPGLKGKDLDPQKYNLLNGIYGPDSF